MSGVRISPGAPHQIFHRSITVDLQVVYCLQIGGVDLMVDHLRVKYTFKKRNVFYFTKRVPKDLQSHYTRDRIIICLKTKSELSAARACKSLI